MLCQSTLVRRQNPRAGGFFYLRRTLGHDHALVRNPGCIGLIHAQHHGFGKTRVTERPAPHRRVRQGVMRAVVVGKAPPAVQLPEGQVHPAQAAEVLQRHQLSRRRQEVQAVPQRFSQIARGVQDVGGDQQVIAVGVEALGDGVFLDIQRTVFDASAAVAEAGLRFREEACGDIRVGIIEPSFRQFRQDGVGRRSGACPDLQHPQPPSFGQPGYKRPDCISQQAVRGARHRRFQVQVGRGRLAAAEQEGQRVGLAAQHLPQGAAGAPEQPNLGLAVRIASGYLIGKLFGILRQVFRQRLCGSQEHGETVVRLRHYPGFGKHFEHAAEQAFVLLSDVQSLLQRLRVYGLTCLALPAQFFQGCQRARARPPLQVLQQGIPALGRDSCFCQVISEQLRFGCNGCRTREEVRGFHSGGEGVIAPHDFVQQVLHALDCREQRSPCCPLYRVTVNTADQNPVSIVNAHFTAQDLRRLTRILFLLPGNLVHTHVTERPLRQFLRKP